MSLTTNTSNVELLKLLKELNLHDQSNLDGKKYIELFENEGIDSAKDLLNYSKEDLADFKFKKAHLKRILRYKEDR